MPQRYACCNNITLIIQCVLNLYRQLTVNSNDTDWLCMEVHMQK